MEVLHDRERGKFYMKDKDIYAKVYYTNEEKGVISIDHTWVDEAYKGHGLGKILMDSLAKFAREENLKIIPICPFVKKLVEKYPEEYKDLLK